VRIFYRLQPISVLFDNPVQFTTPTAASLHIPTLYCVTGIAGIPTTSREPGGGTIGAKTKKMKKKKAD
jgi:hypothetical protein